MIQAVPVIVGTTAGPLPTRVSSTSRPVNTVPRIPSWRKSSPTASRPFAWRTAILAHVPVPHGDRSMTPVQVDGRAQSSAPVETVTTFRHELRGSCGGPDSCPMVIPANPGCSGWTTGSCSAAAALIISVTRVMSRPSSGREPRSPSASASAMT